jgi:hypothetical protein
MARADWAEELADIEFTLLGLRLDWLTLSRELIARRLPKRSAKYRPDQPRVPAGSPEGGQWTDGGGSGPMSFEEWLAGGWADFGAVEIDRTTGEATSAWKLPDEDTPLDWANGRGRGGGSGWANATPGQQARWAASELQAQAAIRRVQELDPRWQPPASMSQGIEGAILSNQAVVRQAEARLLQLQGMGIGPGPFAVESIPATRSSTGRRSERDEIDRIGRMFGCHTCGATEPSTSHGRFIGDHQRPTALNPVGTAQRLFPHCQSCSDSQGGYIRSLRKGR